MSEPTTWIASKDVVFVARDGTRVAGCVRVSLPESTLEHEAACWYSIPFRQARATYGVDHLQALLLALRMCAVELALFVRGGGRIEYPPDADGNAGEAWDPSTSFGEFFRLPA